MSHTDQQCFGFLWERPAKAPESERAMERKSQASAPQPPVVSAPRFAIITNPSPIDRHSVKPPRHIPSDRRWYKLQVVPAVYKPRPNK